jgi:multidrug efflux pump subunit AcrB
MVAMNMGDDELLSREDIKEVIIQAGRARLRPVLLTAITTVLGLFPLAIGLNIDFFSLFSDFDPKIFIGGDNVIFWGPLAWTVIYGLIIATFLTLVIVPILFYLVHRIKLWLRKVNKGKPSELDEFLAE